MIITIDKSAVEQIEKVTESPDTKVRIFVKGGGCVGFQYSFKFDKVINEDDFVIPAGARSVLVDSISAQYLAGSTVSYESDVYHSKFSISNPNLPTTCGCGKSFGF